MVTDGCGRLSAGVADVGSMCARQFQYAMASTGTTRQDRGGTAVTGQQKTAPDGAVGYCPVLAVSSLNPRVRGSSPWRRTRSDLGVLPIRRDARRLLRVLGEQRENVRPGSGPVTVRTGAAGHHRSGAFRGVTGQARRDAGVGVAGEHAAGVAEF